MYSIKLFKNKSLQCLSLTWRQKRTLFFSCQARPSVTKFHFFVFCACYLGEETALIDEIFISDRYKWLLLLKQIWTWLTKRIKSYSQNIDRYGISKMKFIFRVFQLNVNCSASPWFWNDRLITKLKPTDAAIRLIVEFSLNTFLSGEKFRKVTFTEFHIFLVFFADSFWYILPVAQLFTKLWFAHK
jgi:hypothetical protein